MDTELDTKFPLSDMDTSFRGYLKRHKEAHAVHMAGNGLPDYAFSADYELRKKLDAIPGFYSLGKKICATYASRQLQVVNQSGLAVGPNQFSDVYEIARDCAERLGIGIPNIYIINNTNIQAQTIATDDVEPLIIIYSGLYERFTKGELRTVIGHECGHIHNQHGIYNVLASLLLSTGANTVSQAGLSSMLLNPILLGANLALSAWNRAEEVTCDRAGMICCDRVDDSYSAMAKFLYGGAFGEHTVDFGSLEKQLEMQRGNITRLEELGDSHPATVRRIMAQRFFAECDLFYQWRPDLRTYNQTLRSKEETDELCRQYIQIMQK